IIGVLAFTPLGGLVSADEPIDGWLAPGDPVIAIEEVPQIPSHLTNVDCHFRDYPMIIREAKVISQAPFFQTELSHVADCAVQTPRGTHDGKYLSAGTPAGKIQPNIQLIPNTNQLVSFLTAPGGVDHTV